MKKSKTPTCRDSKQKLHKTKDFTIQITRIIKTKNPTLCFKVLHHF